MRTERVFVLLIAIFFSLPPAAHAQNARWSIQVHGGGTVVSGADSGTTTLPPPSAPIGAIPTAPVTRPVPSWFFGDGVTLMNQVNAQVRPTQTATGIDRLFSDSGLSGGFRPEFGVRITRTLSRRFALEGAVSLQTGGDAWDDDVRGIVDAGLASFRAFWQPPPGLGGSATSTVEATADYDDDAGRQVLSTAALRVRLVGSEGRSLYAIGGGGVRSTFGHQAEIRIEGTYNVRLGTLTQFTERDQVTVSVDVDRHVPVGIMGIGWEQPVSPRVGFSVELRSHFGAAGVSTRVSTAPQRNINGNAALILGLGPGIFLSNIDFVDSSLTTELENFRTFKATGVHAQTSVTAGLSFRF